MKIIDTLLTGFFVAAAVMMLTVIAVASALEAAQRSWDTDGLCHVQGNFIARSPDSEALPVPVVMRDGSLDSAEGLALYGPEVAYFWPSQSLTQALMLRDQDNLESLTAFHVSPSTGQRWSWSPRGGIQLFSQAGEFVGTLTDAGFVPGREERSSFNECLQIYGLYPGYMHGFENPGVVVYITPTGFYRADLEKRTIVRIAELRNPAHFSYHAWNDPRPRVIHALEGSKVHWTEATPGGRSGTIVLPESSGSPEVCIGREQRVILRWEIPGSRNARSVRYRVAVLSAEGKSLNDYEYQLVADGDGVLYGWLSDYHEIRRIEGGFAGSSAYGRMAQTVMPLACRFGLIFAQLGAPADLSLGETASPDFVEGFGGLWVTALVSLTLGAVVGFRARRRHQSWPATVLWVALVVAFGIPLAVAHWIMVRPGRVEACASCGGKQSASAARCRRCGAAFPGPAPAGIEIIGLSDKRG